MGGRRRHMWCGGSGVDPLGRGVGGERARRRRRRWEGGGGTGGVEAAAWSPRGVEAAVKGRGGRGSVVRLN
ncbi:hypothetical protein GUJ93_ZPchr0002g25666 [Zizania palustris]|uniref:Uncharacterized protein n=1 Tax=Zizania palustris TaxID=103762 RepID=A0A8J5VWX4_ZIZPA|nr:hypothetical protein GUJ93_ZPchr0002g25666 [Zizania palustris]